MRIPALPAHGGGANREVARRSLLTATRRPHASAEMEQTLYRLAGHPCPPSIDLASRPHSRHQASTFNAHHNCTVDCEWMDLTQLFDEPAPHPTSAALVDARETLWTRSKHRFCLVYLTAFHLRYPAAPAPALYSDTLQATSSPWPAALFAEGVTRPSVCSPRTTTVIRYADPMRPGHSPLLLDNWHGRAHVCIICAVGGGGGHPSHHHNELRNHTWPRHRAIARCTVSRITLPRC